jgi:hypothetical protein
MTVAAILDAGAAAGAGLGSAAGAGGGAGAGSVAGVRGPISPTKGWGFGAREGELGEGSGGAGSSGAQAGSARSAMGVEQGVKSLGTANGSSSELFAGSQIFRAQWELAVSEQSRDSGSLAEEKSTAAPEIADGVHARSFLGNAAEATLTRPNGAMANGLTALAAAYMQPPAQNEATVSTAQESATQSEFVTATAAKGSKTRDGVTAKNAEHNLPVKGPGAWAGAGDPAMLVMAAMQPAPMVAGMQQPTQIRQPAQMISAVEPAPTAPAIGAAQEMRSNSAIGLPVAAARVVATDSTLRNDAAGDATNAGPRAVATEFTFSGGSNEDATNAATHAVAPHVASPENSERTGTNASSGGMRASINAAVAPRQSVSEVFSASSISNFVLSGPVHASGQIPTAAPATAGAPKAQSGLQSGIRSRATVEGRNASATATSEPANAPDREGSKVDANGFDATPGRPRSIGGESAPAAIMHSAQAINLGSDPSGSIQSGLIQVAASGEGNAIMAGGQAGSHAGASGSAAGQASAGNAGGTFAALDSGSTVGADTSVGAPGWVHASGQRAEAGFEDPVLGWVGVRADVVGGTVHAAILPGSAEAAAALGTHLAGLGTYLSEQHASVSAVSIATPAHQGIESGVGQNLQQNAQQNSGQDTRGARETQQQADGMAVLEAASRSGAADISGMIPMDSLGSMSGANISVMA